MERLIPAIILLADTVRDIKQKEIYPLLTVTGMLLGLPVRTVLLNAGMAETAGSMLPGILFLAISLLTRGQAGAGDALVLLMTGVWTGEGIWRTFAAGLFGAALFAGILWMRKRRNTEFPFVPFLLAGFAADTIMTITAG